MLRLRQQLPGLHAGELGKGTIRRLVAPDPLRVGEHRVAAVALLVVAVILIAVDDDLVAHLPALHLGAHRIDDARGIRARDVEGVLVAVDRRDGRAQRRPDAIVVDASRHDEHEALILADLPCGDDFHLHRRIGRAVAFLPDAPGIHVLRHMAQRRDFPDLIEILGRLIGVGRGGGCGGGRTHVVVSLQDENVRIAEASPLRTATKGGGRRPDFTDDTCQKSQLRCTISRASMA